MRGMKFSIGDVLGFSMALGAARMGEGRTRPNPPVGAAIYRGGKLIAAGCHMKCGCDHAEVAAIKSAQASGEDLKGCTMYVTLEPCSKPGRVGACTDAIIASGITRVFYLIPDPNPKNRGKAKRALAKGGVECLRPVKANTESDVWHAGEYGIPGVVAEAERLVAPFAKHVRTGLPYVTVKLAMSLDGKISDANGDAKWISSAEARRETGLDRLRVDAIMVGAGTVRRDDPVLLPHEGENPGLIRAVISRSGKLPKSAKIFRDQELSKTFVFKSPEEALKKLGKMGVMHVLCEGGMKLATHLAGKGFVDEWTAVLAPVVIGSKPLAKAIRFRRYAHRLADSGDVIARFDHPSKG